MKNRVKVLLTLVIGVVVLIAVVGTLLRSGSGDKNQAASGSPTSSLPAISAWEDGGFEFVPVRARCGVSQVGTDTRILKPRGTYCLVMLTVKNVTNQPRMFPEAQQRAVTSDGKEVSADPVAGGYANADNQSLAQEIGPSLRVAGFLVFDTTRGATLKTLQLRGESSSPGITVPVG